MCKMRSAFGAEMRESPVHSAVLRNPPFCCHSELNSIHCVWRQHANSRILLGIICTRIFSVVRFRVLKRIASSVAHFKRFNGISCVPDDDGTIARQSNQQALLSCINEYKYGYNKIARSLMRWRKHRRAPIKVRVFIFRVRCKMPKSPHRSTMRVVGGFEPNLATQKHHAKHLK